MTTIDAPEFSRPIALATLEKGENQFALEASADEKAALTERLGLIAIADLSAAVTLIPKKGGREVLLSGRVAANVTQTCVVSLEPFEAFIEADFDLIYADSPDTASERSPEGVDLDGEEGDLPEPIIDETVDIGEAVAQQVSLELDPFPRAPGAEFPEEQGGLDDQSAMAGTTEHADNPFAVLASLKDKLK